MMLDKLLLNNQILANKSAVQKVRVILVNKQVQKLRKLKQLHEKHLDDKKLAAKITKSSEVLVFLKKLKSNLILRQALLNQVDPKKVVTNGLSSPEETAQALFYLNDKIQSIVSQLKTILNIDSTDTSWREQVLEPSKRKKKQLRTEKKQKIRQERKERNELARKRNEWLVENVCNGDQSNENQEQDFVPEENESSVQFGFKEEDIKESKLKEKAPSKTVKREKATSVQKKLPPRQATPEPESEEDDQSVEDGFQHTVDDFFITQTGDRYLSTVVIDRYQPEQPDDGMVRKERRVMQGVSHGKRKNHFKPKIGGLQTYENSAKSSNSFKGRKSNNFMKSDKPSQDPADLHPSWAAKQKQKGVKTFEGKKIVFDNEGSTTKDMTKNSKKNGMSSRKNEIKEKLHPSWEAKQKLKPNITDFKGKKIKFDD